MGGSETKTKASTAAANNKTKEGESALLTASQHKSCSFSHSAKTKRAPSAYNIFMAKHLKEWKEKNPDKQTKEGMSAVRTLTPSMHF